MERLRDILADNLAQLMLEREDLSTQGKLSARTKRYSDSGTPLAQSSIGRILNKQVHTSLDIVELLAKVFGVSPLEMLGKKHKVPRQAPSFEELHIIDLWRQLKEDDKQRVLAYLSIAVTATLGADKQPSIREIPNVVANKSSQPSAGHIGSSRELAKTLLSSKEVEDAAQDAGSGKSRSVVAKRSRSR